MGGRCQPKSQGLVERHQAKLKRRREAIALGGDANRKQRHSGSIGEMRFAPSGPNKKAALRGEEDMEREYQGTD